MKALRHPYILKGILINLTYCSKLRIAKLLVGEISLVNLKFNLATSV